MKLFEKIKKRWRRFMLKGTSCPETHNDCLHINCFNNCIYKLGRGCNPCKECDGKINYDKICDDFYPSEKGEKKLLLIK